MKKKSNFSPVLASLVAAASISTFASADPARGHEVEPIAGSCNIGTFQQTSKAGSYNVLCNVMEDAEKCLAYIKQHINYSYSQDRVIVEHADDEAKAEYCLEVLKRDLGL